MQASSIKSSKPLVAFFGATGGCSAAALIRALNAGYFCAARDVRDVGAVKSALSPNGQTASLIISGIGIYTLGPVTICAEATTSILSALADLKSIQKPLIVVISTTGITAGPRDVPLQQVALYKLALHKSHQDKTNMEQILANSVAEGAEEAWIRGFVAVRSSLLTNGPAKGEPKLRVGIMSKPAVGYTISREDLGK
ncbi:hypothetical protein MMC29_002476 [Sticta canariensis]|nr:hypothetical protein [Sticta canariensis]